jgi:hypothetical protein
MARMLQECGERPLRTGGPVEPVSRILNIRSVAMLACALIGSSGTNGMGMTPMPQMQNDVPYLTGGVGEYEADAIKKAAKDFDLMLTFATAGTGFYLADVEVIINDMQGRTVLSTVAGPMLLANLPTGTYAVTVHAAGNLTTRQVRVSENSLTRELFTWPEGQTGSALRPGPEPYHRGLHDGL